MYTHFDEEVPGFHMYGCDIVLENNERARALGRQARRFVEEKYDWEVTLQPLDELTDRLLQQKATTA